MPERDALQPPLVLAMLVCDDISTDATSKKKTIVGTFTGILSPGFPALKPSMMVFVELTDGRGEHQIEIRLVDAQTGEPISGLSLPVVFSDPLAVIAMHGAFSNVVIPKAGEYRFQLYSDGELLMERRVVAAPIERITDDDSDS